MVDDPQHPDKHWNGAGKVSIKAGTLAMTMNRFRQRAGCIPWSRQSSKSLVPWLEEKIPASCIISNSTRGFRDLHRHEILEMESLNAGTRSRSCGMDLSHDVHKKRRDEVHQSFNKLLRLGLTRFVRLNWSMIWRRKWRTSRTGVGSKKWMTESEDFRSVIPTNTADAQLLQHLSQPSKTQYQEFTSRSPSKTDRTKSCLDQHKAIRAELMEWSKDYDCEGACTDLVSLRSFAVDGLVWNQNLGTGYFEGGHRWRDC